MRDFTFPWTVGKRAHPSSGRCSTEATHCIPARASWPEQTSLVQTEPLVLWTVVSTTKDEYQLIPEQQVSSGGDLYSADCSGKAKTSLHSTASAALPPSAFARIRPGCGNSWMRTGKRQAMQVKLYFLVSNYQAGWNSMGHLCVCVCDAATYWLNDGIGYVLYHTINYPQYLVV